LYNKIKHDIALEEYLIQEKNFKNRQLIAKFRTSDHCLQIETGWYNNISDILVKEGHLFSIVFISQFLGCWFKWQFKKKWYSSSKILQAVQSLLTAVKDFSYIYIYIMFVYFFFLYVCMLLYCNCLTHMGVICNLNK
jgi:hypothetical protein